MASLYDSASLVMIPSGVKEDKLYSIKPTDGSGDFTFSRGSDIEATRVNSSGLIEKANENLALYSADQTNWTDQIETSVTANASANPLDGIVNADKVIPSAVNGDHYRGRVMGTMSGVITASIYIKADGYNIFDFGIFDATAALYPVRAVFDLSDESITYYSGSVATINSVGGGWYRVSVTRLSSTSGSMYLYHRVRSTGTAGNYSGDGTSGMLLFGAQINHGLIAQDYVETTTTAVVEGLTADLPRLDYSGGASCPSLLLEPSRTNLHTISEGQGVLGISNVTYSVNAGTSPEGVQNASKIIEDSSSNVHRLSNFGGSIINTGVYTSSFFAKAGERDEVYILIPTAVAASRTLVVYNLSTGVSSVDSGTSADAHDMEDYGNGWYRCWVTFTASASGGTNLIGIYNGGETYTGDGTSGLFLYGFMNELGNYHTSYIPTYGTAANRGADDINTSNVSALFSETGGTLFIDFQKDYALEGGFTGFFRMHLTGPSTNNIYYGFDSDKINFVIQRNGTLQAAGTSSSTYIGTRVKTALVYSENDFRLYVNGSLLATDTSGLVPTGINKYAFGVNSTIPVHAKGSIKQQLFFPTALTDAECIALTTI